MQRRDPGVVTTLHASWAVDPEVISREKQTTVVPVHYKEYGRIYRILQCAYCTVYMQYNYDMLVFSIGRVSVDLTSTSN